MIFRDIRILIFKKVLLHIIDIPLISCASSAANRVTTATINSKQVNNNFILKIYNNNIILDILYTF